MSFLECAIWTRLDTLHCSTTLYRIHTVVVDSEVPNTRPYPNHLNSRMPGSCLLGASYRPTKHTVPCTLVDTMYYTTRLQPHAPFSARLIFCCSATSRAALPACLHGWVVLGTRQESYRHAGSVGRAGQWNHVTHQLKWEVSIIIISGRVHRDFFQRSRPSREAGTSWWRGSGWRT